jgi:hypothetical protein
VGDLFPPLFSRLNSYMANYLQEFDAVMKEKEMSGWKSKFLATDNVTVENVRKEEYLNPSKHIEYICNEHGYRDDAWPENLDDVVWCLGDSITLGVGQPFNETWPQILQKRINKRCLNISMLGASNDSLSMKAEFIKKYYNPKTIIIMWGLFSRRRVDGKDVQHDRSDFGLDADLKNFAENFNQTENGGADIHHFLLSHACPDFGTMKTTSLHYLLSKTNLISDNLLKKLTIIEQKDYARDNVHFGEGSSQLVCDLVEGKLSNRL